MPKTESQQQLDFIRGHQLAALRAAALPAVKVDTRNVGGRTMKAVLLAIDSRAGKSGECWASAATLAADCGLSSRAVERALVGLRLLSLVIETPVRRGRANCLQRRIVFTNLTDHVPPSGGDAGDSENGPDAGPIHSEPESIHTEPGAVHTEPGARSLRTGRTFTPNGVRTKRKEGQIKESIEGQSEDGFLEISVQEGSDGKVLRANRKLSVDDLVTHGFLDLAYQRAVECGSLKDCERSQLLIYGFAFRCQNKQARDPDKVKKGELRNAVGWFLDHALKGTDWLLPQVDDQFDRKQAAKLLKRRRGDVDRRTSDLLSAGDREAGGVRDFEAERQRQMTALAAMFEGREVESLGGRR